MPLKLNVGLSKKVGLPDYGSLGASCHLEIELHASLYPDAMDSFHQEVQQAFATCRQAVDEQLDRLREPSDRPAAANGSRSAVHSRPVAPHNGHDQARRPTRQATAAQLRAIRAICDRHRIDLMTILTESYGVQELEDLSLAKASQLIDELKNTLASEEE